VNRFARASGHDGPLKIDIEAAGEAAEEERRLTKSISGDQAEARRGKANAIPGYESTYVPFSLPSDGGTYSPGNVGPIRRL
jgi:hypothetical protein